MSDLNLMQLKKISLKDHPILNEAWLQEVIARNPHLLGLGDVVVRDKERLQASGGRLDILLQDIDTYKRYEMEIQLGKTDESHIIRAIEYWDIEKKRYPQYDHCAVIVAEDITSRFLNVISLFNGMIPLIAMKVSAYEVEDKYFVTFTKVLNEVQFGLVDDDEELVEVTDRSYWLDRGTRETVHIVDEMFGLIKEINPNYNLKYNKFYIGLTKSGVADNILTFKPQKKTTRLEIKLDKDESLEEKMEEAGLEIIDYKSRGRCYRFNLGVGDIERYQEILSYLIKFSMGISTDYEGDE